MSKQSVHVRAGEAADARQAAGLQQVVQRPRAARQVQGTWIGVPLVPPIVAPKMDRPTRN